MLKNVIFLQLHKRQLKSEFGTSTSPPSFKETGTKIQALRNIELKTDFHSLETTSFTSATNGRNRKPTRKIADAQRPTLCDLKFYTKSSQKSHLSVPVGDGNGLLATLESRSTGILIRKGNSIRLFSQANILELGMDATMLAGFGRTCV